MTPEDTQTAPEQAEPLSSRLRIMAGMILMGEPIEFGVVAKIMDDAAEGVDRLSAEVERLTGERDRQYDQNTQRIARIEALEGALDNRTARVVELEGVLKDVDAECTAAIGYEPIPKGYTAHEDVPNGLRTVSHIKLSMIQGYVRAAITKDTADE
jgi:hypothetical protein